MSCDKCKEGKCCRETTPEPRHVETDASALPHGFVDPALDRPESERNCFSDVASAKCCRVKPNAYSRRIDNIFARDLIIGLSDGLTVPFALTAGLSSLGSSHLVVIGGLAELFSGAISMGVGGYLSTKAERDNYRYLLYQTKHRVENSCDRALTQEVFNILAPYGLSPEDSKRIVQSLETAERTAVDTGDPDRGLTSFLLKFGSGVETISTWRLYASALTIGLSYLIGGLIPMLPYFLISTTTTALFVSIGITAFVLLAFGAIKGYMTGSRTRWTWLVVSALQTLAVGALAAAAAFGIVRGMENRNLDYDH